MNRWMTGLVALVALVGCDLISNDGSVPMGKGIDTPDSAWVVTSATDVGKSLPPGPSFASFKKPMTTTGRFVRVHYKVTPKKEKFVALDAPLLVDEAGHEIKPIADYPYTNGSENLIDVLPGAIRDFEPTYEIPAASKKIRAKIIGKFTTGVPTLVNLKL
jgi:hypothetical protein